MKRGFLITTGLALTGIAALLSLPATAVTTPGNFSLQVSPSPLVTTVKPAESKSVELKVRNTSTAEETLKIAARSFTIDQTSGEVKLNETKSAEIASWITISEPTFTVGPGETKTLNIRFDVPPDAGFSYSFAFVINRAEDPAQPASGRQLKGSVAVFTLINVDRPGATRKLELSDVTTQKLYEYLPAEIKLTFRNTGNTIIQPYGNVFIQRQAEDAEAITTLPVNESDGYLLPGIERTLTTEWKDGFPVYVTQTNDSGKETKRLAWNLDKITDFRIGKYTAKVVAVYNDGQRDIPIVKEVTFWVFPYKAVLLLITLVIALIFTSRFFAKRRTDKAVKKALEARK